MNKSFIIILISILTKIIWVLKDYLLIEYFGIGAKTDAIIFLLFLPDLLILFWGSDAAKSSLITQNSKGYNFLPIIIIISVVGLFGITFIKNIESFFTLQFKLDPTILTPILLLAIIIWSLIKYTIESASIILFSASKSIFYYSLLFVLAALPVCLIFVTQTTFISYLYLLWIFIGFAFLSVFTIYFKNKQLVFLNTKGLSAFFRVFILFVISAVLLQTNQFVEKWYALNAFEGNLTKITVSASIGRSIIVLLWSPFFYVLLTTMKKKLGREKTINKVLNRLVKIYLSIHIIGIVFLPVLKLIGEKIGIVGLMFSEFVPLTSLYFSESFFSFLFSMFLFIGLLINNQKAIIIQTSIFALVSICIFVSVNFSSVEIIPVILIIGYLISITSSWIIYKKIIKSKLNLEISTSIFMAILLVAVVIFAIQISTYNLLIYLIGSLVIVSSVLVINRFEIKYFYRVLTR